MRCVLPHGSGIHTYRLRASAMHTVASGTNTATAGASTSPCRLTYGQAVYWIDPLLTTLDKALNQLAGVREIETVRVQSSQK